jgi:hypothetical protein
MMPSPWFPIGNRRFPSIDSVRGKSAAAGAPKGATRQEPMARSDESKINCRNSRAGTALL